jgi:hypothetical protein
MAFRQSLNVRKMSGVDGESCRTQSCTRNEFAAVLEGDNGGVAAMVVKLSGG